MTVSMTTLPHLRVSFPNVLPSSDVERHAVAAAIGSDADVDYALRYAAREAEALAERLSSLASVLRAARDEVGGYVPSTPPVQGMGSVVDVAVTRLTAARDTAKDVRRLALLAIPGAVDLDAV